MRPSRLLIWPIRCNGCKVELHTLSARAAQESNEQPCSILPVCSIYERIASETAVEAVRKGLS